MNKTDQVYLKDMLDALEIIGEASNKLSQDFEEANLDFPVRQAVEMRNFLIHGYDQDRAEYNLEDDSRTFAQLEKAGAELNLSFLHVQHLALSGTSTIVSRKTNSSRPITQIRISSHIRNKDK